MENGTVSVTNLNGIATVAFYHPASNSLPSLLLEKLTNTFYELSHNEEINVIIFRSEKGNTFCAGASFDELLAIQDAVQGVAFFSGFGKLVNAMRKCTKPIIGRIQGKSVGGGVGLIAACDYAMATKEASVKLSEITIGIGPFVVEPAITRKIGVSGTAALAFNPTQWQNAHWAMEKGLYTQVFESVDDLDKGIRILAEQLNSYSKEAVRKLKKILWEGAENWDQLMEERAHICGNLVLSETTKQALHNFKNKN